MTLDGQDTRTWGDTSSVDRRPRPPLVRTLPRFHWDEHQLMLHVLAGVLITAMLVGMTVMLTKP